MLGYKQILKFIVLINKLKMFKVTKRFLQKNPIIFIKLINTNVQIDFYLNLEFGIPSCLGDRRNDWKLKLRFLRVSINFLHAKDSSNPFTFSNKIYFGGFSS